MKTCKMLVQPLCVFSEGQEKNGISGPALYTLVLNFSSTEFIILFNYCYCYHISSLTNMIKKSVINCDLRQ